MLEELAQMALELDDECTDQEAADRAKEAAEEMYR